MAVLDRRAPRRGVVAAVHDGASPAAAAGGVVNRGEGPGDGGPLPAVGSLAFGHSVKLTSAVGAEQSEHLAGRDVEVDSRYRLDVARVGEWLDGLDATPLS